MRSLQRIQKETRLRTDYGRGYVALHFFFRTISKRDALPPHACMQPPRSENAKSFGVRTTLRGPVVVISYYYYYYYCFFPRSVELYYILCIIIIISDREETSYSSSRPLAEKYKKIPCASFPPKHNTSPVCTIFFRYLSLFMHVVNPVTLSRRFVL